MRRLGKLFADSAYQGPIFRGVLALFFRAHVSDQPSKLASLGAGSGRPATMYARQMVSAAAM